MGGSSVCGGDDGASPIPLWPTSWSTKRLLLAQVMWTDWLDGRRGDTVRCRGEAQKRGRCGQHPSMGPVFRSLNITTKIKQYLGTVQFSPRHVRIGRLMDKWMGEWLNRRMFQWVDKRFGKWTINDNIYNTYFQECTCEFLYLQWTREYCNGH
jgi:hypothetical protein